ncbi:hypothetical protein CCACVL1_24906 [Corchorus capsularis]|uniref:Uncharacterized protein n=1 Tax=Corchorus capsularis TaxID=210143 RepID=A0A1R3GML0_COCAP|nr:hypothetical protein CCACVL1_24906 [Corchorus capsularis]
MATSHPEDVWQNGHGLGNIYAKRKRRGIRDGESREQAGILFWVEALPSTT